MQSLLEHRRGGNNNWTPKHRGDAATTSQPAPKWTVRILFFVVLLLSVCYLAVMYLPALSTSHDTISVYLNNNPQSPNSKQNDNAAAAVSSPSPPFSSAETEPIKEGGEEKKKNEDANDNKIVSDAAVQPNSVQQLQPWGYNKHRNAPRWKVISSSIASDLATHRSSSGSEGSARRKTPSGHRRLFVLDYGSDQGYFSISIAKAFPKVFFVMGIELGGVGGEIWKKKGDVLKEQEHHAKENGVEEDSFFICQARFTPEHFTQLLERRQYHDYQLVLSVFHWFDLRTRKEFEKAMCEMLLNSRTTFIELPCLGDGSAVVRKQVGYQNVVKWYDGRSDMRQILLDAAAAHGLRVKVQLLMKVPWLQWHREVFRVDTLGASPTSKSDEEDGEASSSRRRSRNSFVSSSLPWINATKASKGRAVGKVCEDHRDVFKCAARTQFARCEAPE